MGGSSRVRAGCAEWRVVLLLPLLALAGCQTAISARVGEDFSLEQMRAEGNSMVLFHTSLHEPGPSFRQDPGRISNHPGGCSAITMVVARPDGEGRWVRGQEHTVKGVFDFGPQPSQMILPPGEYGIVHLTCHQGRRKRHYVSKVAERGSIWDNSGAKYDHPFATFRVGEGEVVDIGSLAIATGQARDASGNTRAIFVGVVRPIPERFLGNLAAKNPMLFQGTCRGGRW
jgi:hypothetical protein